MLAGRKSVGLLSVPFCSFGYCCYETVWHSAVLGIAVLKLFGICILKLSWRCAANIRCHEKQQRNLGKRKVEFQKICMARSGGVNFMDSLMQLGKTVVAQRHIILTRHQLRHPTHTAYAGDSNGSPHMSHHRTALLCPPCTMCHKPTTMLLQVTS